MREMGKRFAQRKENIASRKRPVSEEAGHRVECRARPVGKHFTQALKTPRMMLAQFIQPPVKSFERHAV